VASGDIVAKVETPETQITEYTFLRDNDPNVRLPMQVLQSAPAETSIEKGDMVVYVRDAEDGTYALGASHPGRVLSTISAGEIISWDKVFARVQELPEATRLGLPKNLSYPLSIETLNFRKSDWVEKGSELCVLRDASGKRVRLSAPVSGYIGFCGLSLHVSPEKPCEVFRIRTPQTSEDLVEFRTKEKPKTHERERSPTSQEKPPCPEISEAKQLDPPYQLGQKPKDVGSSRTLVVTLLLVATASFGGFYAFNTNAPEWQKILSFLPVGAIGKATSLEHPDQSEINPSATANLVDLSTLSNGKAPQPTKRQQQALRDYLQ
jgi:hypothetical protein